MAKNMCNKEEDSSLWTNQVTKFGIAASNIDISGLPKHKLPEQVRDEIPTLNKYGYMKLELDEFSRAFINFAKCSNGKALEVGAAYGWLAHRAMEQDINIIASDISREHLEVLLERAPSTKLDKLHVYYGSFPEGVDLPSNSLSSVLASRILHFLDGSAIESGLEKIHRWLQKGGKLFCTNCSIYHYSVKDKIVDEYKQKEKEGVKWPGMMPNQESIDVEGLFHPFDMGVFERALPKYGFRIDTIKLFDPPSDIYSENREGHIGFIATKI